MVCGICNLKIGLLDRLRGRTEHIACVAERDEKRHQAAVQLRAVLEQIAASPATAAAQEKEVARLKGAACIDDASLRAMRIEVFAAHANQAAADQDVSPEEISELDVVMKALGLDTDAVRRPLKEIGRYAVLHQVRAGKLPIIDVKGPLLEEGEPVHWAAAAELYEEKVIRRYSQGGYSGISIPIYKGIRWHAGGYRSQPVVQTGMVATDHGNLFVTDRRVVYVGQQRSFSIPYKHVLALQGYTDAIAVQKDGMTSKPVYFKNSDPELIAAIAGLAIAYSREGGKDVSAYTFKVDTR